MPYDKDRLGERLKLTRRARENLYFAERDRRLTKRLRARLRNLDGAVSKTKRTPRRGDSGTRSKTYLVPVDFSRRSEAALQHARSLNRETNGKLNLLHVLNENMFHSRRIMPKRVIEKQTRDDLERFAQRARLEPSEYRSLVAWGRDTARTIANYAKKLQAAQIIMGNHGRTGLTRLMLGSVAERTLRYAECPVLVVKKK